MIRIALVAATAATLIALPASAQSPSIHISTVGKSAEQVTAEVRKAATSLCVRETVGSSFPADEMRACVTSTVRAAMAQYSDPAPQLASR